MFARVVVYEISGHIMDEAIVSFGNAVEDIKAMNAAEIYVLANREEDRAVTMTFWEGRDAMEASRVKASHLRSDAAGAVDGSIRSVMEYEVAIQERIGH